MNARFLSGAALAAFVICGGMSTYATSAETTSGHEQKGVNMKWEQAQLGAIVKADDLHISVFREDMVNYGTPTFIWCVQVGGDLYVRAYNGVNSRWYQAALKQKAGRIIAAGKTFDVSFEPVSGGVNDQIDDAYRAKYSTSSYLAPMISERSRAATVRILPKGSTQ
ncbi:hypothetical protein PMM47T1_21853 [Pseudomonas sp. M47T1]|uniref:DUF2255 family protein n=1 Tax=Pseudomonas sp. M47T1 TaxID=1179778 RepID=UPI0002607323|nr:DUF2255 family protein [Pseudomonas sp. M47T1]EIK94393.1 hypothetical protein PMM47T1_21853 [Pseudomonas sp. M47T1]